MWFALSHAFAQAPLEPLWRAEVGPLAQPGLSLGPEGLAVRTVDRGWLGLDATGQERALDAERLNWWDQIGDGQVVFGERAVVLVEPSRTRLVTGTGERALPAARSAVVTPDHLVLEKADHSGLVALDARLEPVWELPGRGEIVAWDGLVARASPDGVELIVPATGHITEVFRTNTRSFGGLGGCLVDLGGSIRCLDRGGVRWSYAALGSVFDQPPVTADVNGDGEREVVAVNTRGDVFVLDGTGTLIAHGKAGPPVSAPVAVDLSGDGADDIVVASEDAVVALSVRPGVKQPRPSRAPSPRRAGLVQVDPSAMACVDRLEPEACVAYAGKLDGAGRKDAAEEVVALACELGLGEACARLTERVDDPGVVEPFWERGCRLGESRVCERWLSKIPASKAVGAHRLACEKGYVAACGFEPPATVPPRPDATVELNVRLTSGGQPLGGAQVKIGNLWTTSDAKGRLSVAGPISGNARVVHPTVGDQVLAFDGPKFTLDLPVVTWVAGEVKGDEPAPSRLRLGGCANRQVVVKDRRFSFAQPGSGECWLASDDGRWAGTFTAAERTVQVVYTPPEPSKWVFRDPDGDPVAPEADCSNGFETFEGYQAICQLTRWPVRVESSGSVVFVGPRRVRPEEGVAWLEPGTWTAVGFDGRDQGQVEVDVRGATAVHVPVKGRSMAVVQFVDEQGLPVPKEEVGHRLGSTVTDLAGRAFVPDLGLDLDLSFQVGELTYLPPRDGLVVVGGQFSLDLTWMRNALGLQVDEVDEARVDLQPGDILREACGYDVVGLSPRELAGLQGGKECPARVWRRGRGVNVVLPPS